MARMSSRRTMVPERKRTNAEGIDTAQNRSPGSAATNRAREQVCTTRPDRSPVSGPARNQFSAGKNVKKGPDRHQDGVSRTTGPDRSPVSAATNRAREQVCTTRPDRSPVSGPARNQFSTGKNVTKGPDRHQDGVSRTNAERIHTAQNRSPVSAGTDAGKTIASGRNR
uniref:(northern house mosquito) hypothetical protein n=1 Tax=Culex pipiens TaxID=7175 RepID=A0A8D8DPJ6_CULPI